jgi:hypothetical protein
MSPMLGILIPADIRDVIAYLSGQKPKATKAKPVYTFYQTHLELV